MHGTKLYPLVDYIDEAATIARFGYSSTTISPKGNKHVIGHCEICGKEIVRIKYWMKPPIRCASCVKTTKKYVDPTPLTNNAATLEKYGYEVKNLSRYVSKRVVGICSSCGKQFNICLREVREEQKCRPCGKKEWWNKRLPVRKNDGTKLLNDAATQEHYGYSALTLSPKSPKHVVINCVKCGQLSLKRVRRNVTDDSVCIHCRRHLIDQNNAQIKRTHTLATRYPEGLPRKTFGAVITDLANFLEQKLGRNLVKEKIIDEHKSQRIDLYDPHTSVGIEYNGLYWHHEHSSTPRTRSYHYRKMLLAQNNGIHLINIFEDEYLRNEEAVKSRLLSILGYNTEMLGARKCIIKDVDVQEARKFLDQHHIQGSSTTIICSFGLYHNDQLIGLISGGKHHRQGHENSLVLTRLCFADIQKVSGGSKRLFKYLKKYAIENNYKKIITWSDNRWTEGKVYTRLDMQLEAELPPDYSYVKVQSPRVRFSKQSQKKSTTGCPKDISERDWALQHGLSRIWNCGHKRWVFCL